MRRCFAILGLTCVLALPACAGIAPSEARAQADAVTATLVMVNNALADEYFHQGDFPGAVVFLERVIRLDPTDITPYASAGWLLWSDGKNDQALTYYQRLVEAHPANPEAHFEMGLYQFRLKKLDEAITFFTQANALGLTAPKRHYLGHVLEKAGRHDEALAFWKAELAANPANEVAKRMIETLSNAAPSEPTTNLTPTAQ